MYELVVIEELTICLRIFTFNQLTPTGMFRSRHYNMAAILDLIPKAEGSRIIDHALFAVCDSVWFNLID